MAPKLVLYLSSVLATQLIALGGQRLQRIITTRVHRDITLLSLNSADQKGEEDLYELLGVPPDASDRVIRGAYHLVASRIHPDILSGHVRPLVGDEFTLRDPGRSDSRTWRPTSHVMVACQNVTGSCSPYNRVGGLTTSAALQHGSPWSTAGCSTWRSW